MSPDSMTVRLHLYRIRVIEVLADLPERLEVAIQDLRSVVRCPWCGLKTTSVHETRRVKVKDVRRGAQKVTLISLRRRFVCNTAASATPRATRRSPTRSRRASSAPSSQTPTIVSITEISRRYGLSWHTVMTLVREWSRRVQARRRKKPCRVLQIDETSLRRRHRYVTVICNAETGEILAVVPHRDFAALSRFFAEQGHRWCRRVDVVVTDGSPSYRAAIERHVGHATHVVDRFHVVRWFATGLIEVRRRVQRIGEHGERPALSPDIFRTR